MRFRRTKLLFLVLTLAVILYCGPTSLWAFWSTSTTVLWPLQIPRGRNGIIHASVTGSFLNENKMKTTPTNKKKPSIRPTAFILSQMRSGSSFVGEIFNKHPGSFYLFEPLWPVQFYHNRTYNVPKWRLKLLRGVATCQFEGLESFMTYFITAKPLDFGGFRKSEYLRKLCEDYPNRGSLFADRPIISKECPIPRRRMASVLNKACNSSELNIAKIIRILDINFFEEVVKNGSEVGQDVKIIHLVRDPRAVMASRIRLSNLHEPVPFSEEFVDEREVERVCQHMTDNVQTQDGVPDWLLGRYALVRYEDVAMAPVAMTEKLYHFIGARSSNTVFDWLAENTNATKPVKNLFSRKRNSRDTVDAWRLKLSLSAVLKVQNICQDALKTFGYKTVKEEADLTNLSLSLVNDMKKDLLQIK